MKNVRVRPVPRHMHPVRDKGRREARAQALFKLYGRQDSTVYVDAALRGVVGVAVAVKAGSGEVLSAVVKAFVVLQASHRNIEDLDGLAVELQEFVKKNTAPYKYPRKVEFVGELPKTISGKVLRTSLRQRENPTKEVLLFSEKNCRHGRTAATLRPSEDTAENRKRFKQRVELYFRATETKEVRSVQQKTAIFLDVAGQEAIDVYNPFNLKESEKDDYELVVRRFEEYCLPKSNETFERYVLRTRQQTEVYRALVQLDPSLFKFRSLNDCVSAGEPMVALCASPVDKVVKPGSMGLPVPNVTIQIHDDEGRELGPTEVGHMAVATIPRKPFGLFTCYRDEPSKTGTVFRNGFYYMGDKAYKDNDGYLWFYARADDVIISAGYRIGPFEVESVLAKHPAVAECAVVGSPDPNRGEVVKAFVVLQASHRNIEDLDGLAVELQEFVKKNTAPYKYPRKTGEARAVAAERAAAAAPARQL
ncbi:acyl-coenzyme A synthetase ACSM3, mitochondrial [Ixodes scapularis]